jgi:hypothetical protein
VCPISIEALAFSVSNNATPAMGLSDPSVDLILVVNKVEQNNGKESKHQHLKESFFEFDIGLPFQYSLNLGALPGGREGLLNHFHLLIPWR